MPRRKGLGRSISNLVVAPLADSGEGYSSRNGRKARKGLEGPISLGFSVAPASHSPATAGDLLWLRKILFLPRKITGRRQAFGRQAQNSKGRSCDPCVADVAALGTFVAKKDTLFATKEHKELKGKALCEPRENPLWSMCSFVAKKDIFFCHEGSPAVAKAMARQA